MGISHSNTCSKSVKTQWGRPAVVLRQQLAVELHGAAAGFQISTKPILGGRQLPASWAIRWNKSFKKPYGMLSYFKKPRTGTMLFDSFFKHEFVDPFCWFENFKAWFNSSSFYHWLWEGICPGSRPLGMSKDIVTKTSLSQHVSLELDISR